MTTTLTLSPGEQVVFQTHRKRAWYDILGSIILTIAAFLVLGIFLGWWLLLLNRNPYYKPGIFDFVISMIPYLVLLSGAADVISRIIGSTTLTNRRIIVKGFPNPWTHYEVPLVEIERVFPIPGGIQIKQKSHWLRKHVATANKWEFLNAYNNFLEGRSIIAPSSAAMKSGVEHAAASAGQILPARHSKKKGNALTRKPIPAAVDPFAEAPRLRGGHINRIRQWFNWHKGEIIKVNSVTPSGGFPAIKIADGKLVVIEEHPNQKGIYRIEFDSHLKGSEPDVLLLGREVTGVEGDKDQLTVYKGPDTRFEFTTGAGEMHPQGFSRHMPLKQLLFSFNGRIPRSTYWYSYLGLVFSIAVASMLAVMPLAISNDDQSGALGAIASILMLVPYILGTYCLLAVAVKRAHDRDHSGWYLLVGLIPLVGNFILLAELGFIRGTRGSNQYGPDPLEDGYPLERKIEKRVKPAILNEPLVRKPVVAVPPVSAGKVAKINAPVQTMVQEPVGGVTRSNLLLVIGIPIAVMGVIIGLLYVGKGVSTGFAIPAIAPAAASRTPNYSATSQARNYRATLTAQATWVNSFGAPILYQISQHEPNFQDDFSDLNGRFGRWSSMTEGGITFTEDVMRIKGNDWNGAGGSMLASDFVISLDVKPLMVGSGSDSGVVVNFRSENDQWYHFGCNLYDSWCDMAFFDEGGYHGITGEMSGIDPKLGKTMMVIAQGDKFAFYLNNRPFGYVRDNRLHGEWVDIGLWSSPSSSEVEFDNVKFWDLKNLR